jgi:hypothetical protein
MFLGPGRRTTPPRSDQSQNDCLCSFSAKRPSPIRLPITTRTPGPGPSRHRQPAAIAVASDGGLSTSNGNGCRSWPERRPVVLHVDTPSMQCRPKLRCHALQEHFAVTWPPGLCLNGSSISSGMGITSRGPLGFCGPASDRCPCTLRRPKSDGSAPLLLHCWTSRASRCGACAYWCPARGPCPR